MFRNFLVVQPGGAEIALQRWDTRGAHGYQTRAGLPVVYDRARRAWVFARTIGSSELAPSPMIVGGKGLERHAAFPPRAAWIEGLQAHPAVQEASDRAFHRWVRRGIQPRVQADAPGLRPMDGSGSISGRVTDAQGNGLGGVSVNADAGSGYGWATTAEDGTYVVTDLPAGDFRVCFDDWDGNYAFECYDNQPDSDSADLVTLSLGEQISDIDAQLDVGGSISGRVTDPDGSGLGGVDVFVSSPEGFFIGGAITAGDGTYVVNGLPAGEFRVCFDDWNGNFAFECYDNQPDSDSADPVTLSLGEQISDIDAQLEIAETFTVNTLVGDGGGITPSSAEVTQGNSTDFTIMPDEGHSIATISGCSGGLSDNLYSAGPITSDCTLVVSFIADTDQPTVLANAEPVADLAGADGTQRFFTVEVPANAANLRVWITGGTAMRISTSASGNNPPSSTTTAGRILSETKRAATSPQQEKVPTTSCWTPSVGSPASRSTLITR